MATSLHVRIHVRGPNGERFAVEAVGAMAKTGTAPRLPSRIARKGLKGAPERPARGERPSAPSLIHRNSARRNAAVRAGKSACGPGYDVLSHDVT